MRPPFDLPVILIVSDNAIKISFLKKALKEEFLLLICSSEESTLDFLHNTQIDIVLIDEKIHHIQPFDLSEKIRLLSDYPLLPVLLMTSHLKKDFTRQALHSGFTDFLNEPLDNEEIHQRLSVALAKTKADQKVQGIYSTQSGDRPIASDKKVYTYAQQPSSKSPSPSLIHSFFQDVAKAKVFPLPLCVLMIEIDHLEKIADLYGEDAIPELSQAVYLFFQRHLRKYDMLYSQRDGAFLLVLPKTSQHAGELLAKTLHEELSDQVLTIRNQQEVAITISIGLTYHEQTNLPAIGQSIAFETLVHHATRALNLARRRGNRTIVLANQQDLNTYEFDV